MIERPLVKSGNRSPYGSVQIPRLKAIRAMAAALMPSPGTPPRGLAAQDRKSDGNGRSVVRQN